MEFDDVNLLKESIIRHLRCVTKKWSGKGKSPKLVIGRICLLLQPNHITFHNKHTPCTSEKQLCVTVQFAPEALHMVVNIWITNMIN